MPASLSCRAGVERSKVLTLDQVNWASVKKAGDKQSWRKVPRFFTWTKVKTLDLSTPAPQDRLAGLVLIAEAVNHIQTSRKSSQAVSPSKLAAILRCSGEVLEKSFPSAGTIAPWDPLDALLA